MDISNHSNNWAGVPSHLLDIISDKLKITKDYLQFGVACQTWHSILKNNQVKHITGMQIDKHIPMLLMPNTTNVDDYSLRLLDITNNQVLDTKLAVPYNKRFCGSSMGWLATVNEDWSITLYKPFSTDCLCVSLPRLVPECLQDILPFYDYFIGKILITADPLTNPDECIIVVTSDMGGIAFIRLAKDSTWTLVREMNEDGYIYFSDFIYIGDHLFPITSCGEIYSFNLKDPHNSTLNLVISTDGVISTNVRRYIVNLDDTKVILVTRYFKRIDGSRLRKTCHFQLFVVDIDGRSQEVVRLTGIGDRAIFLGGNHSICVKASNFNGCRPNCIYFTNHMEYDNVLPDGEDMFFDLGVYDIETKKFEFHFNMNSTVLQALKSRPPIWIVPTFNAY